MYPCSYNHRFPVLQCSEGTVKTACGTDARGGDDDDDEDDYDDDDEW